MLKKSLLNTVIGLTTFTAAGAAFAGAVATTYAGDGNYYSPAPIPIATPAAGYATDRGFVIGIQGGYADTHWDNLNIDDFNFDSSGFAARLYAGWDFNRFFGLELGYAMLPSADSNFGESISNYAIDLLAKLSIPVTRGFSIHAKAGGGYFASSADNEFNNISVGSSHFGPAFGVGADYELIPNLAIGLDWMRYSGQGEVFGGDYQPSPDAVFLGLSYKFPVRYS